MIINFGDIMSYYVVSPKVKFVGKVIKMKGDMVLMRNNNTRADIWIRKTKIIRLIESVYASNK